MKQGQRAVVRESGGSLAANTGEHLKGQFASKSTFEVMSSFLVSQLNCSSEALSFHCDEEQKCYIKG